MNRTARAALAGTATALVLGLVGCSSSDPAKASGLFDEVKSVKAVAEKSHYEVKPKTKRVCTGTGAKRKCSTVPDGTKRVKVVDRAAKPAKWCVELDDVNGNKDADDQWFRVSSGVYADQAAKNEGAKVTDMEYQHKGC